LATRDKNGTVVAKEMDCHIFLPHDWISTLDKVSMLSYIMNTQDCSKFWSEQSLDGNPQFEQNLSFWESWNVRESTPIPLVLHGDAAPHSNFDSVQVLSMKSLLSRLPTNVGQLLLVSLPKQCITENI